MLKNVVLLLLLSWLVLPATLVHAEDISASDIKRHISVWAAPVTSMHAKLLHQVATDLRYSKKITTNFNLFSGYHDEHYYLDIYQSLIDAHANNQPPAAAILPLDVALSLPGDIQINHLRPSQLPTDKISPELVDLVQHGDKIVGLPLYDARHLVLYHNKNLINRVTTRWDNFIDIERLSDSLGMHAITWQASSTHTFCVLMQCDAADSATDIARKLAEYKQLVNQFALPQQCLTQCDTDLCEFTCAQDHFFNERAAMMINTGSILSGVQKIISNKLGISPLPTVANLPGKQIRYPVVLVFFEQPADDDRLAIHNAIITQTMRTLNQKSLYYLPGFLPALDVLRAEILSKLEGDQDKLLDQNLRILKNHTDLGIHGINLYPRAFNATLRAFLLEHATPLNAAGIYLQLRNPQNRQN